MSDAVSTACWKTVFEGVSCGNVTRPPPPPERKEGKKMESDKNFFSCTVSKFFPSGLFIGSQGYINALEI